MDNIRMELDMEVMMKTTDKVFDRSQTQFKSKLKGKGVECRSETSPNRNGPIQGRAIDFDVDTKSLETFGQIQGRAIDF